MTEQDALTAELAALTPDQRAAVEVAAAQSADAAQAKADELLHFDVRQQGPLLDPRMLGPVGG